MTKSVAASDLVGPVLTRVVMQRSPISGSDQQVPAWSHPIGHQLGHKGMSHAFRTREPTSLCASAARACGTSSAFAERFSRSHPSNDAPQAPADDPLSGMGGVDPDEDFNDWDDLANPLYVWMDGLALPSREVEPGASHGGRALSRLEDNRCDKPPKV